MIHFDAADLSECRSEEVMFLLTLCVWYIHIPGGPPPPPKKKKKKKKNGTVDTVDFSGLCSNQQLSFFTLLDRASFSHYNNTNIIKSDSLNKKSEYVHSLRSEF